MIICAVISSIFFSPEREYSGSTPNLKLDTLYVSHYGFVDKGTKDNGSSKIKLLYFLWQCQKCRLFHWRRGYCVCGCNMLAKMCLALGIITAKGKMQLYAENQNIYLY